MALRALPGTRSTGARPSGQSNAGAFGSSERPALRQVNRLERHAGKLARAVLRGRGPGDRLLLPDPTLRCGFRQQLKRWRSVARAADGGRSVVPTSGGVAGRRAGRALRPGLSRGRGSAGRPGCGAGGPSGGPCHPRTTHWSRPPPAAAWAQAGVCGWGRRLTASVRCRKEMQLPGWPTT